VRRGLCLPECKSVPSTCQRAEKSSASRRMPPPSPFIDLPGAPLIRKVREGWTPAELPLRSWTDHYLVYINIGGLLDCEGNGAGDRVGRHRELVSGGGELGFHNQFSVLGSQFSVKAGGALRRRGSRVLRLE
jgi:hypothetical protein